MPEKMKSIANQPGSAFSSHLLSLEEVWFVREHPFKFECVKVKQLIKKVETLESELERARTTLESSIADMNAVRENGNA